MATCRDCEFFKPNKGDSSKGGCYGHEVKANDEACKEYFKPKKSPCCGK